MTSDDCRREWREQQPECARKVDAMHDALLGTLANPGGGFIHRTDERLSALEAPRLRRAAALASVKSAAAGWAIPTVLGLIFTAACAWAAGAFQ